MPERVADSIGVDFAVRRGLDIDKSLDQFYRNQLTANVSSADEHIRGLSSASECLQRLNDGELLAASVSVCKRCFGVALHITRTQKVRSHVAVSGEELFGLLTRLIHRLSVE